jgi:hypothetical protein
MRRFSLSPARVLLALGLLAPAVPSCKDNPPTAIVLAISTEASIPKEIDSISLEVGRDSTTTFARSYAVDPATGQAHIPGSLTFSLHPDEDASVPIRITMKANQKGQQVSLRSATMSFIEGKSKLLRMELRFSCLDFPQACADGETCLGGKCQRDLVDSSKLPDAPDETQKIFPNTSEGGCFDARDEKCAAGLTEIPDRAAFLKADCVLDVGNTADFARLNVFALWSAQSDQGHPLVLDSDPLEGWTLAPNSTSAFQLAGGLCQQVASGQIRRVAFNFACRPCLRAGPGGQAGHLPRTERLPPVRLRQEQARRLQRGIRGRQGQRPVRRRLRLPLRRPLFQPGRVRRGPWLLSG